VNKNKKPPPGHLPSLIALKREKRGAMKIKKLVLGKKPQVETGEKDSLSI